MDLTQLPVGYGVIIFFGMILLLLASGMWISLALAFVGMVGLIFLAGGMQMMVSVLMFRSVESFVLVAVPMFIFMGEIILRSGLSLRLYRGVSQWTSIVPGGLTHSNIVACAIFAAVSGSSVATAATIGSVALPEQEARGYNRKLIMGSLAGGGTLGILIPPSIIMIIYGAFVGQSVGRLFMAGVVPGVTLAVAFMTYIGLVSILRPGWVPRREGLTWAYFPRAIWAIKDIWPMFVLIFLILGGIYLGLVTPTEASALGAFAALVLAALHRRLSFRVVREAAARAVRTTCMVLFILVGARIIGTAMSMVRLPARLSDFIVGLPLEPVMIWFLLVLMYIMLGMFIEAVSMLLLTLPVTYPIMVLGLGFDPIWYGVMLTMLIEMAQITPPVGINLYVIHGVAGGKNIQDVIIGIIPFFFCQVIVLTIYTFLPQIMLWLPNTMFQPRW